MRSCATALLCVAVGLAATGCADNRAWVNYRSQAILTKNHQIQREHAAQRRTADTFLRMEREHAAQRRTTDMLLAGYRACMATGALEDACWGVVAVYRECLDAGGSDAMCRID